MLVICNLPQRQIIGILLLLLVSLAAFGQTKPVDIVAEGKLLYRSEAASWFGTDIFLSKLKSKKSIVSGYFSYPEASGARCIFFSGDAIPRTVAVITFDSTYNVPEAQIDSIPRMLTPYETDLLAIRTKSLAAINADTLFKRYNNTSLNVIPLSDETGRRVYVLSGPSVPNVIVFGNDYRLDFNNKSEVVATHRLHKNIIPQEYGKQATAAGFHSHLPSTGDYITPTDICTLMLYERFPDWKQYYVMSKNYVSIWDCKNNSLFTMTRKAWERIAEDQKLRHSESDKR